MKVGDVLSSKHGTNLSLTIEAITKKEITAAFERRVVDRKTGEITVEVRRRTVRAENWHYVAAAYV